MFLPAALRYDESSMTSQAFYNFFCIKLLIVQQAETYLNLFHHATSTMKIDSSEIILKNNTCF